MKSRDTKSSENRPVLTQSGRRRKRSDVGYERWLTGQLHNMYDPVLKEPVPEELERLLEAFAPRPKANSDKP